MQADIKRSLRARIDHLASILLISWNEGWLRISSCQEDGNPSGCAHVRDAVSDLLCQLTQS